MHGKLLLSAWLLVIGSGAWAPDADGRVPDVAITAPAAAPQFRRYEPADGLPGSSVQAIAQDHAGRLWFAVGADLVSFDGVEFHIVRHAAHDTSALRGDVVHRLFVDRDDQVWMASRNSGLARLDPARGTFARWTHAAADPASLSSDEVSDVAQTSDGAIWVATGRGLDRLAPDRVRFEHAGNPLALRDAPGFGRVHALLATDDGGLWIGADRGLFLRDAFGGVRRAALEPVAARHIRRIQGGASDVRVAFDGGIARVTRSFAVERAVSSSFPVATAQGSARDRNGRLWIASRDGLFLDDGTRLVDVSGAHAHGGLPGRDVRDALADREGGLWFALGDGGIAYLAPGWDEVQRYAHAAGEATSLRGYVASAVLIAAGGELWVGGRGLVDRLDPRSGRAAHVVSGLAGEVLDLAEDARGHLWIVTSEAVYRRGRRRVERVPLDATPITRPRRITPGPDGAMYLVAMREGVFRIDAETLAVAPAALAPAGETGLLPTRTARGEVLDWYAHDDRLLRLRAARGRFAAVAAVPRGERIAAMERAPGGVWLLRAAALEYFRDTGDGVERDAIVPIPDPELAASVVAFHRDGDGRFWLFGPRGTWRLDPRLRQLTRHGLRDGLVDGEMRGDMPAVAADGTIYTAGLGGVYGLRPDRAVVRDGQTEVKVVAASVRRGGRVRALRTDDGLHLGWGDRLLRVRARLASYVDPAANRYWFRLDGVDRDWVEVGPRGEREFPDLAPGNYTLELAAIGAGGMARQLATPLAVHVESPPWTVWQAHVLYACCVCLLLILVLRIWRRRRLAHRRVVALEQERRAAQAASVAKSSFLAMLGHEIRTPLTGVMGMTELLGTTPLAAAQREYLDAIRRSGGMLMRLLNDALDLTRIEAGHLELEPVEFDPHALLAETLALESGLAQMKHIALRLDVAQELPRCVVGDPVRVKQILLNLVNNALKFTREGDVVLGAGVCADGVCFDVTDSGPGIPDATRERLFQRFAQAPGPVRSEGYGLGLAICRELVALMGGSITLDSRPGSSGATFRVCLPLPVAAVAAATPAVPVGCRVLLVEPDPMVAGRVAYVLVAMGCEVRQVGDGLAAMTALAQADVDVVLLELAMDGLDGFRVARLIRQNGDSVGKVPIIALAGASADPGAARVAEEGMCGLLRAPFTRERVAAAFAAACWLPAHGG